MKLYELATKHIFFSYLPCHFSAFVQYSNCHSIFKCLVTKCSLANLKKIRKTKTKLIKKGHFAYRSKSIIQINYKLKSHLLVFVCFFLLAHSVCLIVNSHLCSFFFLSFYIRSLVCVFSYFKIPFHLESNCQPPIAAAKIKKIIRKNMSN